MHYSQLQNFGLDEKESKIYFVLLECGEDVAASSLSKKTNLNRSTIYVVCKRLHEKGFVIQSKIKNQIFFRAQAPEKLISYLEQKSEKFSQLAEEANKILPELNSHFNGQKNWPRVYFYEGDEGITRVYEETLNSSEEILAYASDQANQGLMPQYFPRYYKRRAEKGIPIRAIFTDSKLDRERHLLDKKELRESRLVPMDKINFTPEINFFDNKIMIADWAEKIGIIIESEEISKAFKQTFELAWEAAEKYHKEILKEIHAEKKSDE